MSTTRGCATPVLSDDHIDLIISAAMRWHVITSRTAAAFSSSPAENHALVATAHEAGRMLRTENRAAIAWLAERGRVRPGDQAAAGSYVHCPVERLHPVEVIKELQVTEATWYRWLNQYGSEKNAEASKRTKELEKENARPKRLLAEKELAIDILNEVAKGKL